MRLHPDGVDGGVRAAPVGQVTDGRGDVPHPARVDDLDAVTAGHGEPLGDRVDGARAVPEVTGDAGRHRPGRPEPAPGERDLPADLGVRAFRVLGRLGCEPGVEQHQAVAVLDEEAGDDEGDRTRFRPVEHLGAVHRQTGTVQGPQSSRRHAVASRVSIAIGARVRRRR